MDYRRAGAGLGGESGTDQTFCGENAMPLWTRFDVIWVGRAVATIGANERTLQRASQPSIIIQPDSAMPTGPSRTHTTRITNVAARRRLMASEYPVGSLQSQVFAGGTPGETVSACGAENVRSAGPLRRASLRPSRVHRT